MPDVFFPNLGIEITRLNRVAIPFFIDIYWYGVLITLGVVSGLFIALRQAKRTGQDPELYFDYLLYTLIFCIIGARLYYVLFSWEQYRANIMKVFDFRSGGLAIYGGIIAAVITSIVYTKRKKIDFFLFADTAAPSLLIGQAIGRWGNFFNREVFGGYTNNLFAMCYKLTDVGAVPQSLIDNKVVYNGIDYIQVHPTFLYESVWNLCVFVLISLYRPRQKFQGEIMALYFLGYGLGRAWIEPLRTDQLTLGNTSLAVSQLLSLLLVGAAVVFIIFGRRKKAISVIK